VTTTARLPLSFAQEQLWFLDQLSPSLATYNLASVFRLRGPLDVPALRRGLTLLLERHEVLRTSFGAEDGSPFQVIAPLADAELAVTDLTGLDPAERERELAEVLRVEGGTAYDLQAGPLHRFRLVRLAPDEHVLSLGFHHSVSDGWSAGVLNAELATAYRAFLAGREPALEPAGRYADFVEEQREQLSGAALEEELAYWDEQLAQLPTLELPADRRRPAAPSQQGDWLSVEVPPDLLTGVRALAQARGASLFMVLAAALNVVLSRYTGQEDIPVGVPMLGRTAPEQENVVGLFVNMVVLRTDLSGNPSFAELLDRVADAHLDMYDHQELPFEKVVERVQPSRDPSRNPLFQIGVQVLGDSNSGGSLDLPGVTAEALPLPSTRSRFDLAMTFVEFADRLRLDLEYSTDLFDRWRIEALTGHLRQVLAAVVADPSLRLDEVPLLDAEERDRLLSFGRGEDGPYSRRPVHVDLAELAAAAPDAVALVCRGVDLSYGDFDRQADRVARRLRSLGVRHGQIVAVAMDRDLDTLVVMLGVLKAGAAFTMLDPAHPAARLDYMLRDTAAPLVVVRAADAERLPAAPGRAVLLIDAEWDAIQAAPADEPLEESATGESLAYVLYTSGSTGKPKGVMGLHHGLGFFAAAYRRTFDFGPGDRLLQLPALTFDMSLGEIFTGLAAGATMVLVAPEDAQSPEALAGLMREQRVSYAGLSPAMLSVVEPGPYPDLRCIMGGAEALPAELVTKWNLPGRLFVNLYGPTEAAVACIEYPCEHIVWQSSPPIGFPELGRQMYVVDRGDRLVPVGVPGELLIGGDAAGLSPGYLNEPELTARKFVPDPFQPGSRVYRSGDLVRWRSDGALEFLGRIDNQVKLRGLRIELGEIESALLTHPQVRLSTVLLRPDPQGENRLVAYYTVLGAQAPTPAELRRHLGEQLPEYMVPTAWVVLDEFPLTPARKIDRLALPDPEQVAGTGTRDFVAPRTDTEARVAQIFAEVIGAERVGADDNLFELGGNSLQAMRVVSRLKKGFGVKVNIRMLYGSSTVSAVAARIDGLVSSVAR
jgi:amino acid adenylation domain-containing protein